MDAAAGQPRTKAITALGVLIIMADGYDLQCVGFVAPDIAAAWSVELRALAIVFSAGLAGTIPGAILAGPLANRLGQRAAIILSLLLFGLGTLVSAWASGIASFAALRFVTGIGLGASVPLVITVVAGAAPARIRATLITLTLCGQPLGAILGAALCARLVPMFGWQAAFLLGGLLPLLLVLAVLVLPAFGADSDRGTGPGLEGRLRELFHQSLLPTTICLWVAAFLNVLILYVIVNWLPGLIRGDGRSLEQSLVAISLFNFGGIAGILLIGLLIDRFGLFRIVPSAFFLAALAVAGLDAFRGTLPILYAASLIAGVAGYGAGASIGAIAVLLYPDALRITATGWALGIGRTGAALGPLGVGAALSAGLPSALLFSVAAGGAVLVGFDMLLLGRIRRAAHAPVAGRSA